jgi:hypothetical protein
MIYPKVYMRIGEPLTAGFKAPSFTTWGAYPLIYICQDGEAVCADCVNTESEFRTVDSPEWNVVEVEINWEDNGAMCANCNSPIESAYGD